MKTHVEKQLYIKQAPNQDSSDEEEIQMDEKFQNEQFFFFFMNVERLPIHLFSLFARKIDF